jgi:Spy/CpxP family protein refolding chaperone
MKTNLGIVEIASVLLAGMSASAWAQGHGAMSGNPDAHFAQLKLSPEQKQKVATFREAAMKQAEPMRKEMQAKAAEMKQLWLTDKPDKNAIERKQSEMEAIGHKLRGIWTDFHLQLHTVLTPEQRAKWAEHVGKGPGMMGGGGGMGHGGGMGGGMGHGGMHGGGMGGGMGDGCPCGDPDFP